MIADRIHTLRQTLPKHVRLIAVTKQVTADRMREAYHAGIRDFGENRLQEAEAKYAQLQDLTDVTWHFIGRLQRNKARRVLDLFSWIHSVDSLSIAQRLNQLAQSCDCPPQICLQVKLLPDANKGGWSVDELLSALPALDQCEHLRIQGLMAIPPLGLSADQVLAYFQQLRDLATTINQLAFPRLTLTQLSMGMSDDYPLAVQAGATIVRLGRTIFGDRPL
ncbi:MAG: YggS family pyridoxal phosphate-dependent enzyme [Cyanobacteria bacterium]|nr:YggS family pyridoxal phosphate-dependent enzyme [Cyanobacteriota bacterium]MDW8203307.1 YggS family pyridoxal phosphate-dependent enzyme [Cyanobacteriota bacterium SKYGB_h_bin112]